MKRVFSEARLASCFVKRFERFLFNLPAKISICLKLEFQNQEILALRAC